MLRTRLWVGAILIALTAAVLGADPPGYPFLLVLVLVLGALGAWEMSRLLAGPRQPPEWLVYGGVLGVLAANWAPEVYPAAGLDAWQWVLAVFAAVVLAAFLAEMAGFREPGNSVVRIALGVWVTAYLGVLPTFFAQLRWQARPATGVPGRVEAGTVALALAIFVPKCCDIGAYFTGRFLGRHRLAPVLSPKKTWEGAAGGLAASVAAAFGINRLNPVLAGAGAVVGFGLTVGLAGLLGDLAESLVKRDCRAKDASEVVPGFGGVLDVLDSIIFAAPVAYCWLR